MKNLLFLLSFIMLSCTTTHKDEPLRNVDAQFRPYVQRFIKASNGKVVLNDFSNLEMKFGDFNNKGRVSTTVVGICTVSFLKLKIIISKDWWKKESSYLRREELVFHELAHCVLKRPHISPTSADGFFGWTERQLFKMGFYKERPFLNDGCPSSYMHPYVIELGCIYKHNNFYLKELFDANYRECQSKEGIY